MKLTIDSTIKAKISRSKEAQANDHPHIFNWIYLHQELKKRGVPLMAADWPLFQGHGVLQVERDDDFDDVTYTWIDDKRGLLPFATSQEDAGHCIFVCINYNEQRLVRHNPSLIRIMAARTLEATGVPLCRDWPWAPATGKLFICYDDEFDEFNFSWEKPRE